MILVDSSVWIDFLRVVPTREVDRLKRGIAEEEILIGDLILCEILRGLLTKRAFEEAVREFAEYETLEISSRFVAIEAARNYRTLRAKGYTVRGTIDTLIATRCILDDIPLLYSDRDFDPFVQHLGLRSAIDDTGVN